MNNLIELRKKIKIFSVLIVDDEIDVLDRSVIFLKKFFNNIESANDAKEALEKFQNNNGYDIVITDIMMPEISGWELIRQLRTIDNNIFIVAMSGSPEITNEETNSTDIFLKKPIDIDKMLKIFDKIIQKKEIKL